MSMFASYVILELHVFLLPFHVTGIVLKGIYPFQNHFIFTYHFNLVTIEKITYIWRRVFCTCITECNIGFFINPILKLPFKSFNINIILVFKLNPILERKTFGFAFGFTVFMSSSSNPFPTD